MEVAVQGWENIAALLGVSPSTMMRRKKELQEAGVIFYILKDNCKRRTVCTFPSLLKIWVSKKAARGERI